MILRQHNNDSGAGATLLCAGGQVSLAEMERGLKRMGITMEVDLYELGKEVGIDDGSELDPYRCCCVPPLS